MSRTKPSQESLLRAQFLWLPLFTIFDNYLTEAAAVDLEPVVEGEEAMELEHSEGEEEVVEEKKEKNVPEEPAEPEQVAETSEDAEQVTKPVSFLPRNKEELECLIKHIQDTVTVNILPKLHRCIVAKVRIWYWKGVLQDCASTVKVVVPLQNPVEMQHIKKKKKIDATGERPPESIKEASSPLLCHGYY